MADREVGARMEEWREAPSASHEPSVSIIMPVYNAERYLREAIESVQRQSFTDFEFLIVDDGSTDASRALIEEYAARDPRFRWRSRPNAGIVVTLNELIAAARAPLLARMDADDVCLPDRLKLQAMHMAARPDVTLLGGWTEVIDAKGRLVGLATPKLTHEDLDDAHQRGLVMVQHPAAMMRAEAVRAVGGYDKRYEYAEDLDLWLKLGEIGRVENVGDFILRYRMLDTSLSATKEAAQNAANQRAVQDAWARRGVAHGVNDYKPWRPNTPAAKRDKALTYTWFAWRRAERATARHYALQAVRHDPRSTAAWKALITTWLRPRPPLAPRPAPAPGPGMAADRRGTT